MIDNTKTKHISDVDLTDESVKVKKPFKIIRIPQAPVIFAQGHLDTTSILYTPITSYLNFVITNHSIIIPKYHVDGAPDWVKEKDEGARAAFQEVFRTRKVAMIDAIDLNYKGGGLHCVTLPKPKRKDINAINRIFKRRKLG